jgi:hypothetical protein
MERHGVEDEECDATVERVHDEEENEDGEEFRPVHTYGG